jgi:Ni,Fe-hydrogenase III large subunit/Ni,Fe-hydrogenase III component G
MTARDILNKIEEKYGKQLLQPGVTGNQFLKSEALENQLELEVDPDGIAKLCGWLVVEAGFALISMFAIDERENKDRYSVCYLFAERDSGVLVNLHIAVDPVNGSFPSISAKVPAAALYEREIHDLFGLYPLDHPNPKRLVFHGNWPKGNHPLRREFNSDVRLPFADEAMEFSMIQGDGVFEIPVGPVHAGIIEPGHFRFSLAGEPILNLEAQLYFVHKGIEKLCEGKSIEQCFYIAERISGDETIANSLAFCQAVEKAADASIPARAEYTRVLFAELERLTSHFGDLAGVCLDVAYGFAAFQFRLLRGWSYRIADELCGMRFLRSVIKPGGIRKDFIADKEETISDLLLEIKRELEDTVDIVMHNSQFVDRIENTGILKNKIAFDLNAVGPGGRASGIPYDTRKAFPYAAYASLDFVIPSQSDGDVSSRVKVKLAECFESISLMLQVLEKMPSGTICTEIGPLDPHRSAFGITEAPRGENVHFIMIGEDQTFFRYKVRTPSFCNWPALCHAVQGNVVPDFPLINKSFNLSYAGNDL